MKIAFTSDLHVDISKANHDLVDALVEHLAEVAPDIFIICGDISPSLDELARTLGRFKPVAARKLMVTGNHDIWVDSRNQLKKGVDSSMKYRELIPRACVEDGFDYLAEEPVVIDGVGFAGCMGWYDYSLRNPAYDGEIDPKDFEAGMFRGYMWNDKRHAWWLRRPGQKLFDLKSRTVCRCDGDICREMATHLDLQLDQLQLDGVRPVVVVTHFVPFKEMLSYRDTLPDDFFAAYAGSTALGDVICAHLDVTHALSGHTHRARDMQVGSVRAMARSVGYLDVMASDQLRQAARDSLGVLEL